MARIRLTVVTSVLYTNNNCGDDNENCQFLIVLFAIEPGLKKRVLKQAVLEGDVSFVKYLVTEQGVDVDGESSV